MSPEHGVVGLVGQRSTTPWPLFLEPVRGRSGAVERHKPRPLAEPAPAERPKESRSTESVALSRCESPPPAKPAAAEQRRKPLLIRSAVAKRRENHRLAALRSRVERLEETVASGGRVLSCDLVNVEMDLRVQRTARRMGSEDVRQTDLLIRRAQKLARLCAQRSASGPPRRRGSEGYGFVGYPTMGATPLAAGQMARGPRTPNKGRPARSLWAFSGGLPGLGKR